MLTDTSRSRLLAIGLVCAGLVALVGCGTSASPAPSAAAAASAATPASTPSSEAPTVAPTPKPSPQVGGVCTPTPIEFDPKSIDLTGAWAGDDGGIYYVRQRGTVVWWNGMSSRDAPPAALGRDWNNVGRGEIGKDLMIVADWVDVPRGGVDGYGTVNFQIGADAAGNLQLTKASETGTGRGDNVWTRCTPGFSG